MKKIIVVLTICLLSTTMVTGKVQVENDDPNHNVGSFSQTQDHELELNDFEIPNWQWSKSELISFNSTQESTYPSVVVDSSDNVHFVWNDYTPNYLDSDTDRDVFYRMYNTETSTWSPVQLVSIESNSSSHTPRLQIDSMDNLHVVWSDSTNISGAGTDIDIFYKKYSITSESWTSVQIVSNESDELSSSPQLVIDQFDDPHFVWVDNTVYQSSGTDNDIFYKKFDSSNNNFTLTEVVSTESSSYSYEPSVAIDGSNNVHVTWHDWTDAGTGTDHDIFYKKRSYSTDIWQNTEVISSDSNADSEYPEVVVDQSDNVHIIWVDETDNGSGPDRDIFYRKYDQSWAIWRDVEVVSTESDSDSNWPFVEIDNQGNLHVVWSDVSFYNGAGIDNDIFYKSYTNQKGYWGGTYDVSETTDASYISNLFVDPTGGIHLVWEDLTNLAGSGYDRDVFYRKYYGSPVAPVLDEIEPNPSTEAVNLNWEASYGAKYYNIYRSPYQIHSIDALTPIETTSNLYYTDMDLSSGDYFYAITGVNSFGESEVSNSEYVKIEESINDTIDTITEQFNITDTNISDGGSLPFPVLPVFAFFVVIPVLIKLKRRE